METTGKDVELMKATLDHQLPSNVREARNQLSAGVMHAGHQDIMPPEGLQAPIGPRPYRQGATCPEVFQTPIPSRLQASRHLQGEDPDLRQPSHARALPSGEEIWFTDARGRSVDPDLVPDAVKHAAIQLALDIPKPGVRGGGLDIAVCVKRKKKKLKTHFDRSDGSPLFACDHCLDEDGVCLRRVDTGFLARCRAGTDPVQWM
ncbi:hypothetical protein BU26DRAFT_515921, partial [Trematosphaeria pertusa]